MQEYVLSLNKKTQKKHWISYFQLSPRSKSLFYDWSVKYYFWRFWYM